MTPGSGLSPLKDIGHEHHVGTCERVSEAPPQSGDAAVAVGLEDHDETLGLQRSGRLDRRRHLGAAVCVVVDETYAACLAPRLETDAPRR